MKKIFTIVIVLLFCQKVNAQTFSWSGFAPILDFQTDTIPIVISGLPAAIDTNFGVAHICLNITHTYKADLLIKMVSPTGTIVTLIQSIGGSNDNFTGTCLGMDGTAFSNAQAPYSGLFVPVGDISSFNNGQNPNGTWRFIVTDQANADTGSIHSVSIAFVNNPPRQSGNGNVNSGPVGTIVCPTCVCPGGGSTCDLLPDMTSSAKEILTNHTEAPGFLYISNATPNIGAGPIDIFGIDSCFCGTTHVPCSTVCSDGSFIKHVVKQRIYQKVPGNDTLSYYDRIAGTMTYHAAHGHIHVDHWADYTLRTPTSNPDARTWPIVGTGVKQSFCLVNLGTCSGNPGECLDNNGNTLLTATNNGIGIHTGCGLNQGIYPGSYDVYSISLNDPIPLNNVCNGTYYIVSITDPDNVFLESDETNNWVAVPITLTQQNPAPIITAGGPTSFCQGDSVTLTSNSASNYLWSTGATTQSIVVKTSGTFTVSTTCGSSSSSSAPVTVNVTPLLATATANPSAVICNGDSVHLNASATSGGTQNVPVTFSNNAPVQIPDYTAAGVGVTSSITVSGISPATLNSSSIVSVKINLTHTYDNDLIVSLISPSGTTINLSNRRGSSGDNFTNTTFSMSATTLIGSGTAPFSGSYVPDGSFSTLTGNVNGVWKLKAIDMAAVDTGRIQNWSIIINNAVAETFTYTWSSLPAGFNSSLQNPGIRPGVSTTYVVSVHSNATGCTVDQQIPVTVPALLSIGNFTPSNGLPGTSFTIYGTGFSNVSNVTIAGVQVAGFTILSDSVITAVIPDVSSVTGLLCLTNSMNCSACSAGSFTINPSVHLNLKIYFESLYSGNGMMHPPLWNNNLSTDQTVCDTIAVELHDSIPPHSLSALSKALLHSNGNASLVFPSSILNHSFYIAIRHRNSLETWSKYAIPFYNSIVNFDFTTP